MGVAQSMNFLTLNPNDRLLLPLYLNTQDKVTPLLAVCKFVCISYYFIISRHSIIKCVIHISYYFIISRHTIIKCVIYISYYFIISRHTIFKCVMSISYYFIISRHTIIKCLIHISYYFAISRHTIIKCVMLKPEIKHVLFQLKHGLRKKKNCIYEGKMVHNCNSLTDIPQNIP